MIEKLLKLSKQMRLRYAAVFSLLKRRTLKSGSGVSVFLYSPVSPRAVQVVNKHFNYAGSRTLRADSEQVPRGISIL